MTTHYFAVISEICFECSCPIPDAKNGDRIGTFMFYLSDVEVGGGTGFPVAGEAARPIAGSAAFWHNLKKNRDADYRTWHGGCPVAFGVKWGTLRHSV